MRYFIILLILTSGCYKKPASELTPKQQVRRYYAENYHSE